MRSLTAALALLALAAPLQAQRSPLRATPDAPRVTARQQRADSIRALRLARGAQAEFERMRARHLPWTNQRSSGAGRCDEVIGRFCLWYDEPETEWTPPPEPEGLVRARTRALERLAEAARRAPGDEWIAGQRVRYLVEAGKKQDARDAARACRASGWWCSALQGYAAHAADAYASADSAFGAALAAMPQRDRREWLDLEPILEADDTRALRRMDPAARDAATRRLWWLADPLWMEAGNDRKTEHFARLVHDRLQDRARTTEGLAWGDDLREIVLRFGLPIGYEKIRPEMWQSTTHGGMVVHYASHGREFLPRLDEKQPFGATPPDGERLTSNRARSSYAPRGISRLDTLAHQVAVFRRGDSAVVIAGLALAKDSLPPSPRTEAGLVLAESDSAPVWMSTAQVAGSTAVLRVTAPPRTAMFSLEARELASRRAGRARYSLPLDRPRAGGMALSDVLLLADPMAHPATLDEAAPLVRPGTRFKAGDRVGLFWEVYRDAPTADTLRVSLALARRAPGGVRRIAERIGLAPTAAPVRMRWTEESGGAALLPRSTTVALPQRLPPGEYLLEVTVHPAAGPPVTSTRALTIER
jgi:hypothetical protein